MIDRGISENYLIFWMEDDAGVPMERVEQCLNAARTVARHGAGGRSLIKMYEDALAYFGGNTVVAAEFLRRALIELAYPTPVDDALPPPDSWQWEHLPQVVWHSTLPRCTALKPPPRSARRPRSSR